MSASGSRMFLAAFLGLAGTGLGIFVPSALAGRRVQPDTSPTAASERQLWIVNQPHPDVPTDLPPYEIKLLEPLPDPALSTRTAVVPTIKDLPTPQASVAPTPRQVELPTHAMPTTVRMTKPLHTPRTTAAVATGDISSPGDYLSRIDRILSKMREGRAPVEKPKAAVVQPKTPRPEPELAPRYAAATRDQPPTARPVTAPSAAPVATPTPRVPQVAAQPPVEPAPTVASLDARPAEPPVQQPAAQPESKRSRLLSLLALPAIRQPESTPMKRLPPAPVVPAKVEESRAVVQASATEPLPPIELSLPETANVAVELPAPRPAAVPAVQRPATNALATKVPKTNGPATATSPVDPSAVRAAAAELIQPKSLIQSTLALAKGSSPPAEPKPSRTVQTALAEEPIAKSTEMPATTPYPDRPKIYFRPAVAQVNRQGYPILRPEVRVAGRQAPAEKPPATLPVEGIAEQIPLDEAEAISPAIETPIVPESWSAPFVAGPGEPCGPGGGPPRLGPCQELLCRVRARLNGPCSVEPGIGTERVMHAISFVDTSQPQNNFRLRFDAAYDYQTPDRAEYFWAKIGTPRGPTAPPNLGETSLDYQEVEAFMELGGDKFSVGTSIPILIIDPENYANTSGLGDITITTKTVFLDGSRWQLTNLLRTYIPSADSKAGLGTGHASIEPGFAWRYKWSDITYLHGDLKYWVPLGGDPVHSGEVLNYGFAISHVWRDSDAFAIMPTLELVAYSFLDGQFTAPNSTATVEVDPQGILTIHPGIRWVWDSGSDCGVREFGIFGGIAATSDSVYEEILRAEMRWVW